VQEAAEKARIAALKAKLAAAAMDSDSGEDDEPAVKNGPAVSAPPPAASVPAGKLSLSLKLPSQDVSAPKQISPATSARSSGQTSSRTKLVLNIKPSEVPPSPRSVAETPRSRSRRVEQLVALETPRSRQRREGGGAPTEAPDTPRTKKKKHVEDGKRKVAEAKRKKEEQKVPALRLLSNRGILHRRKRLRKKPS
jgi:hypothetical protein